MFRTNRKSFSTLMVAGALCTCSVALIARADDMSKSDMAMAPSPELKQASMQAMDQAKQMAGDSNKSSELKEKMAKEMVMDEMIHQLAMDPQFQQQCKSDMQNSDLKQIHDQAKQMAEDPQQMKSIEQKIESDPKEMMAVNHQAAMMAMMHEHMGMGGQGMGNTNMGENK